MYCKLHCVEDKRSSYGHLEYPESVEAHTNHITAVFTGWHIQYLSKMSLCFCRVWKLSVLEHTPAGQHSAPGQTHTHTRLLKSK